MSNRRLVIPILVGSILIAACGSDPPVPPEPPVENDPPPTQIDQPTQTGPTDEERAEAERQRRLAAAIVDLEQMVFFDYDEATITSEAEITLRSKVDILRSSPAVRLRIEGHADERGSTEYNIALASERAESVREFLPGFGLDAGRFEIISYGEGRPLVNRSDEAAWARNRRAQFVITAGRNQINVGMDR